MTKNKNSKGLFIVLAAYLTGAVNARYHSILTVALATIILLGLGMWVTSLVEEKR